MSLREMEEKMERIDIEMMEVFEEYVKCKSLNGDREKRVALLKRHDELNDMLSDTRERYYRERRRLALKSLDAMKS